MSSSSLILCVVIEPHWTVTWVHVLPVNFVKKLKLWTTRNYWYFFLHISTWLLVIIYNLPFDLLPIFFFFFCVDFVNSNDYLPERLAIFATSDVIKNIDFLWFMWYNGMLHLKLNWSRLIVSRDSTVNLFHLHCNKKKKKRFMSESHADVDLRWDESSLR